MLRDSYGWSLDRIESMLADTSRAILLAPPGDGHPCRVTDGGCGWSIVGIDREGASCGNDEGSDKGTGKSLQGDQSGGQTTDTADSRNNVPRCSD
jgi:hypothetical protein